MTRDEVDQMVAAYVECALWSSHAIGEDGEDLGNLDEHYGPEDLTDDTRDEMAADCSAFYDANAEDLVTLTAEQAGHDFWLTRNGHGAGFWDRGLGELGERLADAARVYGGVDLMPMADGQVTA